MYDHFADQVLSAEKTRDKVDMTMRGCDLPTTSMGSDPDSLLSGRFHALSVACVFKQLLAGLPNGILGSIELYRALLDISEHKFSNRDEDRSDNRLVGITFAASMRVKAIALAILALTSDMQLELICAVFGLCALLLHETGRLVEQQRQKWGRVVSISGMLDLHRLGFVFGPLLTGIDESAGNSGGRYGADRDDKNSRVTVMMIEDWRGVSRQLRMWEVFGFPSRDGGIPATVCKENFVRY